MLGPNLDILYPNANQTPKSLGYQNVIYWNDTKMIPYMPTMPPQTAASSVRTPPVSFSTTIELYAIVASIVVALAIAGAVLRGRRLSALNSAENLAVSSKV
jgi:hypothetical protein